MSEFIYDLWLVIYVDRIFSIIIVIRHHFSITINYWFGLYFQHYVNARMRSNEIYLVPLGSARCTWVPPYSMVINFKLRSVQYSQTFLCFTKSVRVVLHFYFLSLFLSLCSLCFCILYLSVFTLKMTQCVI